MRSRPSLLRPKLPPDTRHRTGAEGSGQCRAPPSYGDVLGPRRFDGTLREHGPGGPTRTWAYLSLTKRRYNYFRQVTKAWFDNEGRRSVYFQTGGLRISAGGARADGGLAEARRCRPVTRAHSWKQRKPACPRVFCQSEGVTPAARVHTAAAAKLANVL